MSMTAGSVIVADDESVTSSGLAKALYDAEIASLLALSPSPFPTVPTLHDTSAPYSAARPVSSDDVNAAKAARLRILRDVARRATAQASALVTYFQANMQAKVATTDSGLQRVALIDTQGPAADKFLSIV